MKLSLGIFLVGITVLAGSLALPGSSAAAGGTIEGAITIEGQSVPGGPFWLFVVPTAKVSSLTVKEASEIVMKTDNSGRFSATGLVAGDYFIAPLIPVNQLKNASAFNQSIRVPTADFGTLTVPAMRVSLKDGQRIPLNIVRVAIPAPPPGFTIPHSGDSDFGLAADSFDGSPLRDARSNASRFDERDWLRIAGLATILISAGMLLGPTLYRRFSH